MNTQDTFNLQRFLEAQENDYADALHEIKQGYKQSHWIWFIFPQMRGLGSFWNMVNMISKHMVLTMIILLLLAYFSEQMI